MKKIMKRRLLIILAVCYLLTISLVSSALDKQILTGGNEHSDSIVTIYYAEASVEYSKYRTGPYLGFGKHINVYSRGTFHSFDANLEELVLEIVVNYTVAMNFTAGFPYVIFAPITAFGLKIENYSDYVWQSFKLKHDGYAKREGNISVEIPFDMDNIEKGDKFLLEPKVAIVGDPMVYTSKDLQFHKYTSLLLRFAYHIPNKTLLEKWLLPFIAEHDWAGMYGGGFTKIYILFE